MKNNSVVARLRSVTTGAPSSWADWHFGTRIVCLALPSRSRFLHARHALVTELRRGSLSVPFLPRSNKYRSVEDVVAMNPVGWGYQLYFSSDAANEEIGNNVRIPPSVSAINPNSGSSVPKDPAVLWDCVQPRYDADETVWFSTRLQRGYDRQSETQLRWDGIPTQRSSKLFVVSAPPRPSSTACGMTGDELHDLPSRRLDPRPVELLSDPQASFRRGTGR
jgi:hypothetical protein